VGRNRHQFRAFRQNSGLPAGQSAARSSRRDFAGNSGRIDQKLVSDYHEAIEQEQLRVASLANIEMSAWRRQVHAVRATVVTAPEFELPEYKNIPVQLPETTVSEPEIDASLERLRDQSAISSMFLSGAWRWAISASSILRGPAMANQSAKLRPR
jgi:hypothetical protein